MRAAIRSGRALLLAGGLLAAVSCSGGDGGGGGTGPPQVQPATLTLGLTGAQPGDKAILVSIDGPAAGTQVSAVPSGALLHSRAQGAQVRAILFGDLADGDLLTLRIPDAKQSASYSAAVVEVVDDQNGLRPDLTGYALSLRR